MPSASWTVYADKHSAVPDAVLKNDVKYTLSVNEAQIVLSPLGLCCGPKRYILPLEAVEKIEMITAEFSQPGMMLTVTKDGVQAMHKLWVTGGEEAISRCCDWVNAARRLLEGLVVIAGTIDPKAKPSPLSITYFTPEDAAKLFEARQKLVKSSVGTTEVVTLAEGGDVTVLAEKYGVTMLTSGTEEEPASVFIKEANNMTYSLHMEEQMVVLPGAEVETKAWRMKTRFAEDGPGNLTCVLSPETILYAPFLAGLGDGGSRSRVNSRMSLRLTKAPTKAASKPAKAPKAAKVKETKESKEAAKVPLIEEAPVTPREDKTDEPTPAAEPAAPEGTSKRQSVLAKISRKKSLTKGAAEPVAAPAEAPATAP